MYYVESFCSFGGYYTRLSIVFHLIQWIFFLPLAAAAVELSFRIQIKAAAAAATSQNHMTIWIVAFWAFEMVKSKRAAQKR